jgi:GntR family transcriptional regulator
MQSSRPSSTLRLVPDAHQRGPSAPLYRQVREDLIRRVLKGEWGPGAMLPSEKQLAKEYGHSQGTVRKALMQLFDEGLVIRRSGRGTFVASHAGQYKPASFHPIYDNGGARVVEDTSLYIRCERIAATKRVAAGLKIAIGAGVSQILRLRRSGGRTAVVETTYLPDELCPDAYALVRRERPQSLYALLERAFNILITDVDERVRARLVTDDEAALLEIAPQSPVLEIERTALSLGGHPVEWRTMVCATSEFYYRRS